MVLKQVLTPSHTALILRGVDRNNRVSSRTQHVCSRTRHTCIVRLQKAPQEAIQEAAQSDRIPSGADYVRGSDAHETLSEESKEVTEQISKLHLSLHQ